jgi:hypothetical protein
MREANRQVDLDKVSPQLAAEALLKAVDSGAPSR